MPKIRLAAALYPPYIEECGLRRFQPRQRCPDPDDAGLNAEIFALLLNYLNIPYKLDAVSSDEEMGEYDEVNNTWTGMYSRIYDGEIDIYASLFALTPLRMRDFTFSYPLFESDSMFIVKGRCVNLFGLTHKSEFRLWWVILAIVLIISAFLCLEYRWFDGKREDGLFYRTIGFVLKTPPIHYERLSAGGSWLLVWLGFTLVVVKPLYTSYLPPMLLYPTMAQPLVTNMEQLTELLYRGDVHLIMTGYGNSLMQEIHTSNVTSIVRLREALARNPVVIERTADRILELVASGKYVHLASNVRAADMIQFRCDLSLVPAVGLRRNWLAVMTTKNFSRIADLNQAILINFSHIMVLSQKYTEQSQRYPCSTDRRSWTALSFASFLGAVMLHLTLLMLASAAFFSGSVTRKRPNLYLS